jgi:lactoylglutathione lyase
MATDTITIERVDHIGIRVRDYERALAFYRVLGFELRHRVEFDDVAIIKNAADVEINLILNAKRDEPNILMDVPEKHPGITHIALLCADILAAKAKLEASGFPLSGGPIRFGPKAQGIFVRDPDGNVIELHQRG